MPCLPHCEVARGDVLIILDADLTMPPEQLPKFWDAIRSGKGEFVNGSRLVYPMEDQAMRFLNLVANKDLLAAVHLAAVAALHRHAVRHQGASPLRLCAAQGRPQLFRKLRSVRGFRPDLRRLEARSEGGRDSHPLCQPHIWRDADLAVPPWLHAAAHGAVRVPAHQGDVTAALALFTTSIYCLMRAVRAPA